MPQPPLFQSPRAQRLSVTVAMAAVFAGAMALAYLTAAVSAPAPARETRIAGLRLLLPGDWVEVPELAAEAGVTPAVVLGDPQREQRWLLVTTDATPSAVTPQEMVSRYLAAILDPVQRRTLEPIAIRGPEARGRLRMVRYMGLSRTADLPGQQLHLAATVSVDGLRHWLIYVTDRVEPGESFVDALRRNVALLGRMEQTAHLDSGNDS